MKKILLLGLLAILTAGAGVPDFEIETRVRVINEKTVEVIVQVDNNTMLTVAALEGFVTILDGELRRVDDQRLVLLKPYEKNVAPNERITRSLNFPYDPRVSRSYKFHIAKIQFTGDYRIYTWHPAGGLIRID
ncbi:MAG: hypothetical protein ABIA75_07065 [Candidatus Neomarinimicrobiota bacterium]